MEHASDHPSTLAMVAVTLVGLSTIFVSMRQAPGVEMSTYDLLLTRNPARE